LKAPAVRILHLITRLPVGGAERLLVDIARYLPREQFESLVCCIQDRGELAAEVEAAGIPFVCLNRMRSKRFDWRAVGDLAELMRRERIDLVHAHLYHANLYGRLAALRAGVPAIATVHNTYTRTKLHRRLLNRLLARASARVVAVSDDIRRDVLRYDGIPQDKIATIQNGIDVSRVASAMTREAARARLGIPEPSLALGCVARLEEQKGHCYLLDALALLCKEAPAVAMQIRLVVAGDGRLRSELEAQAQSLGVAGMVSFLGTRRDIADILRALDVYVMPSLWEGLSLALLEAMAAGLPIIASDVGGVSQVLGAAPYGFKVPPGNAAALANAVRQVYEQPREHLSVLGKQASQRVREAFSLEAMIGKLAGIYRDAAAR
jgi:glycosyltransferase involved in cell wall biosynthesis